VDKILAAKEMSLVSISIPVAVNACTIGKKRISSQ
jgi:hypothetical protein